MRCCVPGCPKSSVNKGISFHLFPKDSDIREAWLKALNLSNWVSKERSTVCSEHFNEIDFYVTKSGLRKLKNGAVPYVQESDKDLDAPADTRVCRICLATDTKMFSTGDNQFDTLYSDLIGIYINDDRLPQKLCWECTHRLHSYHRFKSKAIRSRDLLLSILTGSGSPFLTIRHIKSINRTQHQLNSNLVQEIFNTDEQDCQTEEDNVNIKPEVAENEIKDLHESKAEAENDGVEVKEEEKPNEIFVNYYDDGMEPNDDNFDSEDDVKLSEVKCDQGKKKERVKVKKRKCKEDKVEKSEKKKEVNGGDDSPVRTVDKYKTSNVKRRRTNDGLNESLFAIVSLSFEEQIAEIEKRKDSSAYVNATYKCTLCFRGFPFKDRYDAHVLRHSDQAGAFECFICKARLKSGRALRKHVTSQHTEQYMCKGCPFVTRNRGVAREHEKWHSGTRYQCPHCPSEFDKLTTYMGHLRIKHVSSFVCALCGFTFVSKKGVDVHMKKKHRLSGENVALEGPYCEVCDVKFVSEDAHARHLKLSSKHSSDNDPNRIRNDSQSMGRAGTGQNRNDRSNIIERKQPNERITCEQCGIELRDLRIYAQHFRRAHPDKNRTKYPAMKTPFMCELCGRIFQSMALLKDHNWVHTGVKRFKCDRCDKSFTQKTNLVFHLRSHGGARPLYPCHVCGKHFAFFNNRRRHMFIHTGLKPFSCGACGKCFTTAGEQRAHHDHVHLKKPWPRRTRAPNERNSTNETMD